MAFIAKLALTLVAVSTAAGIYLVVLGGWLVDRSFTELREARLTFVLFSLRSTVEANLDLGFGLRDVQQIQDLIEREKAADPTIEAIDVSTPDGVSVFSTDRGAIGDAVPEAWRRAQIDQRGASTWRAFDRGEAIFGTAIEGDFGQTVGQIAIEVVGEQPRKRGGVRLLAYGRPGPVYRADRAVGRAGGYPDCASLPGAHSIEARMARRPG